MEDGMDELLRKATEEFEERIVKKEDGKEDCEDEELRSDKKRKENERGIRKYAKKGKFEK